MQSDADTLTTLTAIKMTTASDFSVVVVGTDIDLFVMQVARATPSMNLYML